MGGMDCLEWRREIVLQTSLSDFVWQRNVNCCMHGNIIIVNRVEQNGHTYAHTVCMDELIVPICTYVRTYTFYASYPAHLASRVC